MIYSISVLFSVCLNGSYSIKLYAWEPAFIRRISQVRNDQELRMMRKIGLVSVRALSYSHLHLFLNRLSLGIQQQSVDFCTSSGGI